MDKILSNQIRCLSCGDEPFSAHRYDFKFCRCGKVAVDGGMEYLRRAYSVDAEYLELSIEVDEFTFEMCMSALEWSDDTGRNNLGRLSAIFRALRNSGFLDRGME